MPDLSPPPVDELVSAAKPPRWRRRVMHLLLILVLAYVGLALFVMCAQRKMIYFPTRMNSGLATHLAAQEGFRPWRNHRGDMIGWMIPSTLPATGSVLVVHGNA